MSANFIDFGFTGDSSVETLDNDPKVSHGEKCNECNTFTGPNTSRINFKFNSVNYCWDCFTKVRRKFSSLVKTPRLF
jgi:hypothetical protein